MTTEARKPIRTVLRAVSILNSLGAAPKGISAVAKEVKLSKGTVFDLLRTLEQAGYVSQDQQSGVYELGAVLIRLASNRSAPNDLAEIARPYLQQQSDDIGEVSHLGKLEGQHAAFLVRTNPSKSTRMLSLNSQVGEVSPLHCTSIGKVLLASLDEDAFAEYAQADFEVFTSKTIRDADALKHDLKRVRKQGYALNVGEYEEGVASVAVPVRDGSGTVIAAINMAMPSVRMPTASHGGLVERLKRTAAKIENELASLEQQKA